VILATVLFGTTLHTALSDSATIDWLSYARIAWKYYSPGIGVNPNTGIHRGNLAWNAITDWDTGGYIIATIDAHSLGLIPYDGLWGFRYRIEKILRYLLTRQLGVKDNIQNWPYSQYYWDGRPLDSGGRYTDSSDSGRLLYALDLLRKYDPSFQSQIQSVFQRCKTAYDVLSTHVDARVHYYGTLDAVGFTAFGYDKSYVISAFQNWAGPYVVVEGQPLPQTETTAEPTLHGILELGLGGNFFEFSRRVYEAQKSRWASTTRLSGWSEGGYPEPGYIYEWVLTPQGERWVIIGGGAKLSIEPLTYTKVAFGYLAIFGNNPYTFSLFNAAKSLQHPEYGFGEATMEDGTSAISLWKMNTGGFYSDKTNQIILAAARYALSCQTTKTSTSTSTITVTTTVTATPTTSSPPATRPAGQPLLISHPVYYSLLGIGIALGIIGYTVGRRGRRARLIRSLRKGRDADVICDHDSRDDSTKLRI